MTDLPANSRSAAECDGFLLCSRRVVESLRMRAYTAFVGIDLEISKDAQALRR